MVLRKFVERITKSVEDTDREHLAAFCDTVEDVIAIEALPVRVPVRFAGEVRAVRMVPRAGAPATEVTVHDGRSGITLAFLGRRRIAGMSPGRRLIVEGVVTPRSADRLVYNPWYRFLPR